MDLTSAYGDLPPAVQSAMKQRAADIFDLSAVQPHADAISIEAAGVPADRRKLPTWAILLGVAAAGGLVWYATKKS